MYEEYLQALRASMSDMLDHVIVQQPDGTQIQLKKKEKS